MTDKRSQQWTAAGLAAVGLLLILNIPTRVVLAVMTADAAQRAGALSEWAVLSFGFGASLLFVAFLVAWAARMAKKGIPPPSDRVQQRWGGYGLIGLGLYLFFNGPIWFLAAVAPSGDRGAFITPARQIPYDREFAIVSVLLIAAGVVVVWWKTRRPKTA